MRKAIIFLLCMVVLTGCYYDAGFISVNHETIDVGQVIEGDSVYAKFRFKNKSSNPVRASFMPECDCTTVSKDSMELAPGEHSDLKVSVSVESAGEFCKYVFVQKMEDDEFLTIAIVGFAE